jgi:hypothetical protein
MHNIDIKSIQTALSDYKENQTALERAKNKLADNAARVHDLSLSIELERELSLFPCQAIGSVAFYNSFNNNFEQYESNQFNKIIRFLSHVESLEAKYRDLYSQCAKKYYIKPINTPIEDLRKEKKAIDFGYGLLAILANEVQGDLVKFNQVYNKLEDEGLFMTVPEKRTQEYLVDISYRLDNVLNGLKALFETLQETNSALRDIEGGISDIAAINSGFESLLWDISFNTSK